MFRHCILAFCLTAAAFPFSMDAQKARGSKPASVAVAGIGEPSDDDDKIMELLEENHELNKQLKEKNKAFDRLTADYDKLKKKYEGLDGKVAEADARASKLRHERDSLKLAIVSLEKGRQALADARVADMQNIIDSLDRELINANRAQEGLVAENTQLSKKLAETDGELSQLRVFKRDYIKNLASVYTRNWASKLFSQIDSAELDNTIADCKRYASEDIGVGVQLEKLLELQSQYRVYAEGERCLVSEYDRGNVASVGSRIAGMSADVPPVRKQEMDDLYSKLGSYKASVSAFQLLVRNIDESSKDYDTHVLARPFVDATLEDEDNKKFIGSVRKIPWLNDQLDLYLKALDRDCKAPNKVHDLILGLKIM